MWDPYSPPPQPDLQSDLLAAQSQYQVSFTCSEETIFKLIDNVANHSAVFRRLVTLASEYPSSTRFQPYKHERHSNLNGDSRDRIGEHILPTIEKMFPYYMT
jgi:hypothetical protein